MVNYMEYPPAFDSNLTLACPLLCKKRGVDDKKLLPYFPYRDDGEKILSVIEDFAKDYVDLWVKET